MTRIRMARRVATVAILALVGGIAFAAPAAAEDPSAQGCTEEKWYDITSSSSKHIPAPGTHYKDGPGGNMTVSVTRSSTLSTTASVTAGATVGGIVAQAKVEVSAQATKSNGITIGHTYSHKVPKGRYGHLQYGSWGHKVSWRYGKITPSCTSRQLATGSASVVNQSEGWRWWHTAS